MRRPVVCILCDTASLEEGIKRICLPVASKVTSIDPLNITDSDKTLLNEAEVIISDPHFASLWLQGKPNLKWVQGTWAGIENVKKLITDDSKVPAFQYSRVRGIFGQPIAEYVVSYIIAEERKFKWATEVQQTCTWSVELAEHIFNESRTLDSLSIGILGLGEIGNKVAEMCKACGMRVWTLVNRFPPDGNKCTYVDEYRAADGIDELLSNCHYVCNILPSTQLTRGLLDNEKFKACSSKRSVFINVGRGDICTEDSILQALREKWIGAAILDVLPTEPLPLDSLLWKHPQVTITPHVAAGPLIPKTVEFIAKNLQNYIHDKPLEYVIDWSKSY